MVGLKKVEHGEDTKTKLVLRGTRFDCVCFSREYILTRLLSGEIGHTSKSFVCEARLR